MPFPAAILPGTTLVLSPLVALMEDQVRGLTARGISATYIASTVDSGERRRREEGLLALGVPARPGSRPSGSRRRRSSSSCPACSSISSPSTRRTASRSGGTTSAPTTCASAVSSAGSSRRASSRAPRPRPPTSVTGFEGLSASTNGYLVRRGPAWLRAAEPPPLGAFGRGPKEARAALAEVLKETLGDPKAPRGGAIIYARDTARRPSNGRRGSRSEATARRTTTRGWMRRRAPGRRRASHRASSTSSSRRTRSAWGSIDPTSASSFTCSRPRRSSRTTRRSAARGVTGTRRLGCSSARAPTSRFDVVSCTLGDAGGPADPALAARAWGLFRELLRYIDARTCRHDFVLRYFGDEQELLGGCGRKASARRSTRTATKRTRRPRRRSRSS